MDKNINVLYSKNDITKRVSHVAEEISKKYCNEKEIIVVCLLKGGAIFASDLIREITGNVIIDFMMVSSYGDEETSSGVVKIIKDIDVDIKDKTVIIVDDIVDTGLTLFEIKKHLKAKKPLEVETCCLLNKTARRSKGVSVDYYAFECPDEFVVGYGMDAANKYRNLPYIGIVV